MTAKKLNIAIDRDVSPNQIKVDIGASSASFVQMGQIIGGAYKLPVAQVDGLFPYGTGATGTGVNATANGFSSSNQALWLSGTLTGTGEGPHAFFSATDTASNSTIGQAISAVRMQHSISTGAGAGNRITLYPILIKSVATPGSTKALKGYLPFFAKSFFSAGDGGGSGTEMGNAYGGAVQVNLNNGATFYETAQGFEIDVSVQTGASTKYKNGLLIAGVNNDAVKGSTWEAMLAFTKEGTSSALWDRAIDFNYPPGSWSFSTTATLIGSSASATIGTAIDFSNLTTTWAWKSVNCTISGSGAFTATTGDFAGTVTTTGAAAGFAMGSRSGAGTTYQWFNPVGAGISLYNGSSTIVTVDSGGIVAGKAFTPSTVTVAGLPGSPAIGTMMAVSDGTAALAWGATVTGGGSTKYLVWWNGANWTVMGK